MVPLHNGFTIRIRLARTNDAFVFCTPTGTLTSTFQETVTTTDWMKLTDGANKSSSNAFIREGFPQYKQMTLVTDYYELSPGAEAIVRSSLTNGEMVIHSKSYRHSNFYVGNKTREVSHLLNSDLASVRNFYWFMRHFEYTVPLAYFLPNPTLQGDYYTGTYYTSDNESRSYKIHKDILVSSLSSASLSNRIRNGLVSWWLKIDNEMIPSHKGIESGPDLKDFFFYKGVDPNNNINKPSNEVWADRSCDSLFQLLKTQDIKKSIYTTLIDKYSYQVSSSLGLGYPIESVNPYLIKNDGLDSPLEQILVNPKYIINYNHGKFAGGYNLQARPFSQMGVATGTDLRGKVTRLEAKFQENSDIYPSKAIVDTYLEFDSYIKIIPNVLTTVSF